MIGEAVCYFFGTVWFVNVYHCTVGYAMAICVVPFIVPDLVKFVLSSALTVRLEKYVR